MTLTGHFIDDVQRRDNAVRLRSTRSTHPSGGTWATPYTRRSPRAGTRNGARPVTLGRSGLSAWSTSSCGDLAAWMLYRLGLS